jgi:hypothetical protein
MSLRGLNKASRRLRGRCCKSLKGKYIIIVIVIVIVVAAIVIVVGRKTKNR